MNPVTNPNEFPNKPHYAIIIFETSHIHHEGDERSRTNPGHGYPAYTETVKHFKYFAYPKTTEGKAEWEGYIQSLYKDNPKRTDVVAFEAEAKLAIRTNVIIGNEK